MENEEDKILIEPRTDGLVKEDIKDQESGGFQSNEDSLKETDLKLNYNFLFLRLFLILIGICFVFLNALYGFLFSKTSIDCIVDKTFIFTDDLNLFFSQHIGLRHSLLIFSSMCIDLALLSSCIMWIFFGRSWRLIFSLFVFYISRFLVQGLFQLKYPEGYLWEDPGILSLTVSYYKSNDFFFSGHVGLPIIVGLEFKEKGFTVMYVFCLLSAFLEAFTMIVLRGHYCVDIITGAVMGHYVYMIVKGYIEPFDTWSKINRKNELFDKDT